MPIGPELMSESSTIGLVEPPVDRARGRSLRLLLLLAGVMCLAASLIYPFPMTGRLWGAVFDLAHAPVFFVVFLFIVGIVDPAGIGLGARLQPIASLSAKNLALLAVILCVIGVIGEFAQGLVSRSPSLLDAVANCSGLLAAMFWCASRKLTRRPARWMLALIAPALVLVPVISPVLELQECLLQRYEFPLLASFERPRELNAWSPHQAIISATAEWASQGLRSMRIHRNTKGQFPGATMVFPIADWTQYSQLQFDVCNPQDTDLSVGINIADSEHASTGNEPSDRFQKWFLVAAASAQTITIELSEVASAPATRRMVMTEISLLDIFLPEAKTGTIMFLDNICLTRSENP